MKPIDRKALLKAAQEGRTDVKEVRKSMLSPVAQQKHEIDERDPMDRVADELSRFTEAVYTMGQGQAQELTKILQLVLTAVDRIGQRNTQMHESGQQPIRVNLADTRPTEWGVEIVSRDREGKIEKVKLKAK
jgi:hypothetical protein